MRAILFSIFIMFASASFAQTDTIASGLYSWNKAVASKTQMGEYRPILNGSSLDLASFKIHSSVLNPGLTNHTPRALYDREEIVIVKSGTLTMTINGVSKTMGANSVVLIEAGDTQNCSNPSTEPVTYYVIAFKSKDSVNIKRGRDSGGSVMADWTDLAVKTSEKGASRPIVRKATSMFPTLDIHATTLNPGKASHAPHTHRAEEMILLIEGSGEMLIGNEVYKATAGDLLFVNSSIPHAFTNTGTVPCSYFAIQWMR